MSIRSYIWEVFLTKYIWLYERYFIRLVSDIKKRIFSEKREKKKKI